MKKNIIIYILSLASVLTSCHYPIYEKFVLNRSVTNSQTILGYKMKNIDSIDVPSNFENVLILKEGALVSLRCEKMLNFTADFTMKLLRGNGIVIYFRTTEKTFDKINCLKLEITKYGCKLLENNVQIGYYQSSKLLENEKFRIKIINDGKLANVFFDCAELCKHKTNLPLTEYMIIESIDRTNIELSGIDFAELQ